MSWWQSGTKGRYVGPIGLQRLEADELPDRSAFAEDADRQAAIAAHDERVAAVVNCSCGGDIHDDGPDGGRCVRCGLWWGAA